MNAVDAAPQDIVRVRADNPSPLTLDGTNSYVTRGWVVDPGPRDPEHVERVLAAAGDGIEGIVLTHDHLDHAGAAEAVAQRSGAPIVRPRGDERVGPFEVIATPGHSPDSVCLLLGRDLFTGDTVLGAGSVFIQPGEGSLSAYLSSLERLRDLELDAIWPGHGPPVREPRAKLDEYIAHRLDRERALLAALEAGARTDEELLDAAWSDVAERLRPAAAVTLAAHLEKLADERRLPDDFPIGRVG